jgi:ribosomal protein S27AE
MVTDLIAVQEWNKIPKQTQESIINNVHCPVCGLTTIVNYSMQNDKFGIRLEGKCKKCGGSVVRLLER